MAPALFLALAAVVVALGASLFAAATCARAPRFGRLYFSLLGLSGVLATGAGLAGLFAEVAAVAPLPLGLPWLPWRVRLDALSGFFLVLIGLITAAVALFGSGYVREFAHGRDPLWLLGGLTGVFVAGMLLVVLADDAFLFMVAWELMSVSSYFLVVFQHDHSANRRAAFLYLLMAHIGALSILLGFGVLAGPGHGFTFDALRTGELSTPWASVAFGLAFLGFGMKAGLVPLHAWLPEAHPAAPSHISALMSGVMLKVAVYGFIRFTFDLLGDAHMAWGVIVLLVGSVSAFMGVLYALMQHDLKRLLAYHSVENIGIIFIGLGLALVFFAAGERAAGVLAFVAALYHTLNHAIFKSLLFFGAGAVLHTSHERDIDRMGGLLRRMPWTGLFFLVGCISISALPPFNGFVSEWLTFQAAFQAWNLQSGVLRSILPITAAMLAVTGALAAACFVKVYGIAFLGQARSRNVRRAREVDWGMRAGQGFLAILCLALGVLPAPVVRLIDQVPQQLLDRGLNPVATSGWLWLTPLSAEGASYGAPMVLVALALVWWGGRWLLARSAVRRCDAWDCGFSPPDARMQYTATAFAQPIRRVFGLLFRIEEGVEDTAGRLRFSLHVDDRAWGLLYAPVARFVERSASRIVRLQTGQVRTYLAWSLATLLVLLWMVS